MSKIFLNSWILSFIEYHARSSVHEIYGWLVGTETSEGDIEIISVIACENYYTQHVAGASPDPLEIQWISSAIPHGIGILGLYHSHPSEVFHSSTDDKTLMNLSRFYPKMISIVTNGEITKCYQCDDGNSINEAKIISKKIDLLDKKILFINSKFDYSFEIMPDKSFTPQLTTQLLANFENIVSKGSVEIIKCDSVIDYLYDKNNLAVPFIPEKDFNSLKPTTVKKYIFESINKNIIDKLRQPNIHLNLNLNYSTKNGTILKKEKDNHSIIISGQIYSSNIFIIPFNKDKMDSEKFFSQIKSEICDELISKISKSVLKYFLSSKSLGLVYPETIILPYYEIPLKINVILKKIDVIRNQFDKEIKENLKNISSFNDHFLPSVSRIADMEDSMLNSIYKRSLTLNRSGNSLFDNSLVKLIALIYNIRGQNKKEEFIRNVLNLLEKL